MTDRYKLTQALVVDPLYLQHSYSESAIDYRVSLILDRVCLIQGNFLGLIAHCWEFSDLNTRTNLKNLYLCIAKLTIHPVDAQGA